MLCLEIQSGKKDNNAAFYSNNASSSKGQKGGSTLKRKGKCHNCGKKGHWMRDCWEEGGGKEGQGPKQKSKKEKEGENSGKGKGKGKDVAAAAKDDKGDKLKPEKEEEAWMAMIVDETACDLFENDACNDFLILKTDLDGEDTLSCLIEEDEHTNYSVNNDLALPDLFDGIDQVLDDAEEVINADQLISAELNEEVTTRLEAAYLIGTAKTHSAEVDLYDLGTTRHMSRFFHQLFNYVETERVSIITADKRPFHAVGKGDMYVYLPN